MLSSSIVTYLLVVGAEVLACGPVFPVGQVGATAGVALDSRGGGTVVASRLGVSPRALGVVALGGVLGLGVVALVVVVTA